MLMTIYIMFLGIAFSFMMIAFFRKDMIIFGWLSAFLFLFAGINSGSIEMIQCSIQSNVWTCVSNYSSVPLIILFNGLGIFMLVYSIMYTFI